MMKNDGHYLDKEKLHECSRWMELRESLKFHIELSYEANIPSEFRLLNSFAPVLVTGDNKEGKDEMIKLLQEMPRGDTPICSHLRDVIGKLDSIKVALENNKPKGHLVKPGPHLTLRYVLTNEDGVYIRGKEFRGTVPWIWEIKIGELSESHFNFSNTAGDSGKTAVINAAGMNALTTVFFDRTRCPLVRQML